jgi:predicted nucleic acid-binding protein
MGTIVTALFDTGILIDCAYGLKSAVDELDRYEKPAISRIVWIEFLTGARTPEIEKSRQALLTDFDLLEVTGEVASETNLIRQNTRLKLPDAIILATARVHGLLLVTRNYRDFPRHEADIRIPY